MSKVVRNYIYNVCYQLLIFIAPIFTAPYLARVLGPELMGTSNYITSVSTLFTSFGLLGINNYGIRQIAYVKDNIVKLSDTFFEIFYLRFLLGIVTCIAYSYYVYNISEFQFLFTLQYFYVVAFFVDPCWLFIGLEDMRVSVARNFIMKLTCILGIFLFVKTKDDLELYVFLLSIMTLVPSLMVLPLVNRRILMKRYKVSVRDILKHLMPSIRLFLPSIAIVLYLQTDKIILENFVSLSAVSFFDQAEKIVKIPLTFISVISVVLMPKIANDYANNNFENLKKSISTAIEVSLLMAFPMMFGIIFIAPSFVPIYLGAQFMPVVDTVKWLAPIIVTSALIGVFGEQYLVATDKTKILTYSNCTAAIFNVLANIILVPVIGIFGSVVGTLLAQVVMLIIQYYYVSKEIDVLSGLKSGAVYFVKTIPMLLIMFSVSFVKLDDILSLIITVLLAILTYILTLFITKDRVMNMIISKLLKKRTVKCL